MGPGCWQRCRVGDREQSPAISTDQRQRGAGCSLALPDGPPVSGEQRDLSRAAWRWKLSGFAAARDGIEALLRHHGAVHAHGQLLLDRWETIRYSQSCLAG